MPSPVRPGENANNVTIDGAADCTTPPTPQPWHLPEVITCDPGTLSAPTILLHRLQGELEITKATSSTVITCR